MDGGFRSLFCVAFVWFKGRVGGGELAKEGGREGGSGGGGGVGGEEGPVGEAEDAQEVDGGGADAGHIFLFMRCVFGSWEGVHA